ncbi:MAG: enoyl-CoA hydratase-related protein [Candidatus Binatia bacterium]
MTFQTVKLARNTDGIAVLTLDRPAVLNSINQQMIDELRAVIADVAHDESTRVVIMTGTGRAFCAGADLGADAERELGMSIGEGVYRSMDRGFNPLVRELAALAKPVVAAVNGVVAGGGVGLALAADIVVAARSAEFIQVFGPQLGLVPDMGCTYFLVHLLGRARARGLALLGERLTAQQAEQWGLIWKCVGDDMLMGEAQRIARRLAAGPQQCFGYIKRTLDAAELNTLSEQLDLERDSQRILGDTEDFREGVVAFLNKRKPQFKGR